MNDKYYIVLKNDTLSHIAKLLSGNANNYDTIAAVNGLIDPDKIKEGQRLLIPKKFNKPLKKSEIPTKNKILIIDNYSPTYNYIIEDDKIYYSKKNNDHWVDISDNEKARKNLYNFIGDKYNFKGYLDNEKNIWNKIKEGNFNYSYYRDSVNNVIKHPIIKNTDFSDHSHKTYAQKDAIDSPLLYIQKQKFTPIGIDSVLKILKEKPKKEVSNTTYNPDNYFNISQLWRKGKNWISRLWGKMTEVDETVTKLNLPYPENKDSKYAIRPGSYTGNDTIRPFKDRRYIIPESIDVSEYTFGYRNRGQIDPIDTEGGIITTFSNFLPYGKHIKGRKTYIGIDLNGKLIAGSIDNFKEGSYLSPTFSNVVTKFITDKNGNILYTPSKKNPGKVQPVAETIDANGKIINNPESQAINILVNKGDKKGTYGNITGGRYLVKVGNETRLLSGSVENIRDEFEAMKKRNNSDRGIFYTLDNGSFNMGLRTIDKKLTAQDLEQYDLRNDKGGGNFLYLKEKIIPKDIYKSDTILTPNIRTVKDESYKKGHGLTNELKGVVLHHTAFMNPDLTSVINHLRNPKSLTSSHVVIGYDGTRKVLAKPTDVTFHAGASVWNNRDNVNDFMLGIEFLGDTNKKDLTEDQIKSAIEYLKPIIKKYNISLEDITTHELVRSLYNDFAKKQGKKLVPAKQDVNQKNYKRIIKELLKQVYYVK